MYVEDHISIRWIVGLPFVFDTSDDVALGITGSQVL